MRRLYILLIVVLAFYSKMQAQCEPISVSTNDVTKAIALVSYNGLKFTGTVVNNEDEDGTYYFMTTMLPFHIHCGTWASGHIPNISFKWANGSTTSGATLLTNDLNNEFVALLELDNPPPFDAVSYLGFKSNAISSASHCITNHDNGFSTHLAEFNIQSSDEHSSRINVNCISTNNYEINVGDNVLGEPVFIVEEWDEFANMNEIDNSQGAPLLNSNNQIVGIYVTKTGGVRLDDDGFEVCGEDDACFYPDIFYYHSFLGSNIRAIKIEPCVEEIVESEDIETNKTTEASIRIIGKSKINNVQVRFKAGTEVILEDGFESGDDFIAEIKPCVAKITPIAKRRNQDYYQEEEKENNFNENISLESVTAYPTVEIDDYIIIESNGLNVVSYAIIYLDGKIITQGSYDVESLHYKKRIEFPSISNGIYYLKIESEKQLKTIKLIKQ